MAIFCDIFRAANFQHYPQVISLLLKDMNIYQSQICCIHVQPHMPLKVKQRIPIGLEKIWGLIKISHFIFGKKKLRNRQCDLPKFVSGHPKLETQYTVSPVYFSLYCIKQKGKEQLFRGCFGQGEYLPKVCISYHFYLSQLTTTLDKHKVNSEIVFVY